MEEKEEGLLMEEEVYEFPEEGKTIVAQKPELQQEHTLFKDLRNGYEGRKKYIFKKKEKS